MPEHRAYLIGSDGHITNCFNLVCCDDASAIKQAEALIGGHDIELWQLDRQIATFEHKPKSKA
jgi:hypothetical protein